MVHYYYLCTIILWLITNSLNCLTLFFCLFDFIDRPSSMVNGLNRFYFFFPKWSKVSPCILWKNIQERSLDSWFYNIQQICVFGSFTPWGRLMGGSPWVRIKQTVNQSVVQGLLLIRGQNPGRGEAHFLDYLIINTLWTRYILLHVHFTEEKI